VQNVKNRQGGKVARHQLATNSPWRVIKGREEGLLATSSHSARHGELSKEENRQGGMFARYGE